ncbi:hypothetical protein DBR43_03785 [Pedobacter sp. KBW06]|uniref:RNA polymerase sigma factor n=1 Tax=Pedobacter sp. KBW06 TaxID=2153359 RepID=UPI000F59FFEA|nr:sigma factor [Pedobacter sp. KBW06]RQO74522.1 hypothetical protein DBR43_03785 [Pedobacter sp. KBW06]
MELTKKYANPEEMLEGLLLKDINALEAFYYKYSGKLYGIIAVVFESHEARISVLQRAILRIWSDTNQYDPEKEKFFTWMLKIVRESISQEFLSSDIDAQSIYDHGELSKIIEPCDYPVFFRTFFFNTPINEIAEELSLTPFEAQKSLYQAIDNLKKHFAQFVDQ